jgi:hypothetical protein
MERAEEINVVSKLKSLVYHLVASFPQASILFREIAEGNYLFVIVPYSGETEKVVQVHHAVLREQTLTEEEFARRVERLHLAAILQGCGRYELGPQSWPLSGDR